MYKQILTPDKNDHSIDLPEKFYGKKVEVIVMEIGEANGSPVLPPGKNTNVNELFEDFGTSPDFPSIDEIRAKAWGSKW